MRKFIPPYKRGTKGVVLSSIFLLNYFLVFVTKYIFLVIPAKAGIHNFIIYNGFQLSLE